MLSLANNDAKFKSEKKTTKSQHWKTIHTNSHQRNVHKIQMLTKLFRKKSQNNNTIGQRELNRTLAETENRIKPKCSHTNHFSKTATVGKCAGHSTQLL